MKKWINNLSFALWMTAMLATGTAFARTLNAAASAASVAAAASLESRRDAAQDMTQGQRVRLDADGKLLPSQGTGAREAGNEHDKPHVLAFLTLYPNGPGK